MTVHINGPVSHTAREEGNRGWFSELPVAKDPNHVVYFNDFLVAKNYSASDWVVTTTEAGAGDATEAIAADELNGALILTNDDADNDLDQLQSAEEWFKMSLGKQAWYETKIKISDATQSEFFVGFATTDTDILTGTTDCVGFRKVDGATTPVAITEDNTTETTTTLAAVVADTYVTLGFHWDGVHKVQFYVNRAIKATHYTNIEQTNKLAMTFLIKNGEAAAKTLTIDYVYVAMER